MVATLNADVQLRLPRSWPAIALSKERIVTPRCDCRSYEVGLAWALSSVERGDVLLICGTAAARARVEFRVRTWLEPTGVGKLRGDRIEIEGDARSVWIDEATVPVVATVIVVDAHAIASDPIPAHAERSIVIGRATARGHWSRAREYDAVHRLDVDAVIRDFPDQRSVLLEESARDVSELDTPRAPFITFARDRLKVRSDKKASFLTTHQQREAHEQLGDAWYSGRAGTPIVSLWLSAMQRRYLARKRLARSRGRPARFLLLKYRRGGFTTLEQALSYYECATAPGVECATLAHTVSDTQRIFEITQRFHENDPRAPRRLDDSKSKIVLENGSSVFTGTAGGHGFARGATLRRVHGSEVAQWCLGPNQTRDVDVLVAGLLGAASNGEVVLESTPNGVEWFCQTYRDAKRGLNDWTPIFLPWFADRANRAQPGTYDEQELVETRTPEEQDLVARHSLSVEQLAWRRATIKSYGRLFRQEFPEDDESCFLTSGICYFPVEVCLLLLRRAPQPIVEVRRKGYTERRWEQPVAGVEYVAGVDTSEGIPGCDPNGIGIMRRDTGEQVLSIHGHLPPHALADETARVCTEYNGALTGVERQNHGHAVLQRLRAIGFDKPHFRGGSLYYFHRAEHRPDVKEPHDSDRPGWDTNSQTRDAMLADLAQAVEDSVKDGVKPWVRDAEFLSECMSFRLQSSGKFEADSGAHDDSVIKWAIAWQMRKHRRSVPRVSMV